MAVVVIVGAGNVGLELRTQLIAAGHDVRAVATSRQVTFYRCNERHDSLPVGGIDDAALKITVNNPDIEALMIAMPNGSKGVDELRYMQHFSDKIIVTCAKAAHAYQYHSVRDHKFRIGCAASCGGGTDMIETLRRRRLLDESLTIYAVLNGTLNFIFSQVQQGASFISALRAAQKLGYAEPGNGSPVKILNGEIMDCCMKATIVNNVALGNANNGRWLEADMISVKELTSEDIPVLTSRNARYRFIMTFSSADHCDFVSHDSPGSIRARWGRWLISGGFHDVRAESPFFDWLREVGGVNNGFTIHNSMGEDTGYALSGPGAGPVVTAAAMVRDLHHLLQT